MPIRVRMTAWYLALLALVLAAIAVFVVVRLRADLTDGLDRTLRPAAAQIASGYASEGAPEFRDTASSLLAGERAAAQILGPDGRVLVSWGDPIARRPLLGGAPHFRIATVSATRHGRRVVAVAAVSLAPVDRSVHRVTVLLALACPVALLLAALVGWLLARRALRPVDEMTAAAAAIGVTRLGDRVAEPRTDDEVGRLAATLNAMLERIQSGVEEQQRLIADTSHELRTPLATMRSELDVSLRLDDLSPAARRVLESAREEVERLSRTVEDLLTLASADAGRLEARPERIDLADAAAQVAAAVAPLASARGVTVEVDGAPAPARADPDGVRHSLRNVVENAIEFSPHGGRVLVQTHALDGHAALTISDEGPGIPPEHRERIFERFYRVDASRTRSTGGTGLGLAIADELIRAAGGRIWVEPAHERGSAFHIELPAA